MSQERIINITISGVEPLGTMPFNSYVITPDDNSIKIAGSNSYIAHKEELDKLLGITDSSYKGKTFNLQASVDGNDHIKEIINGSSRLEVTEQQDLTKPGSLIQQIRKLPDTKRTQR